MKKILYLPVEVSARELDSKLLLAHRAISNGYSIIIGRKNFVKMSAEQINSGIYFNMVYQLKSFPERNNFSKIFNVVLDEEGLVYLNEKKFIQRSDVFNLKHLDILFTWGLHQSKLLIKNNHKIKNKIRVVGNPRFDLLKSKYNLFLKSIGKEIKDKQGDYILINTNFPPGNFSPYYKMSFMEKMKLSGNIKNSKDYKFYLSQKKYCRRLLNDYREMILALSKKFPYINFIIRPHPSENYERWKRILNGISNIKVIYEGSSVYWIAGAICVIHTGCTTGIEAWALKKPVIQYNPYLKQEYEPMLPNKLSCKSSSIEELEILISSILKKKDISKNISEDQLSLVKPFIDNIEGGSSVEKIIIELEKLYDKNSTRFKKTLEIKKVDRLSERVRWRLLCLIQNSERIKFFLSKTFIYKFVPPNIQKVPSIKTKLIKNRFDSYDKVYNESITKNIEIKEIAPDTYFIKKSNHK